MSEELENQTDFIEELTEEVEVAEPEEAAELATDSDEESEDEPQESEEEKAKKVNQDKVNAAINRKHREMMEAKEEAERYKQQLSQYQSKAESNAPTIPEEPDPFSDNYKQDKEAYNAALRKHATWEAEQSMAQSYKQQIEQANSQKQAEDEHEKVKGYAQKAKTFGISPSDLQQYGQSAGQYLNKEMAMRIVSDDEGPLLTKYLAQNPMEAMQLSQMNDYEAAIHIERNIRPTARSLKTKTSTAPKPPTKVRGSGGKIENESPLLKGATFE